MNNKMKKIFLLLLVGIFLIGIISAITLFGFIKIGEETQIPIYPVCLKQSEVLLFNSNLCNTFKNKYLDINGTSLNMDLISDGNSNVIKIYNKR